jgi:hypothetical protein
MKRSPSIDLAPAAIDLAPRLAAGVVHAAAAGSLSGRVGKLEVGWAGCGSAGGGAHLGAGAAAGGGSPRRTERKGEGGGT